MMNVFKKKSKKKGGDHALPKSERKKSIVTKKPNSNHHTTTGVSRRQELGTPQPIAATTKAEPQSPLIIDPSAMINKNIRTPKKDKFVPRRDHKLERCMGTITGDSDIWVERFYISKKTPGRKVYYFRSVKTKRCVLMEPPTGSSTIVYWDELDQYPFLHKFATEPLDIDQIMERPEYNSPKYKTRQKMKKAAAAAKNKKKRTY